MAKAEKMGGEMKMAKAKTEIVTKIKEVKAKMGKEKVMKATGTETTTIKIGKVMEIVEKRVKTGLRMYLMMC